jgi:hypothetical protein
MVLEARIFPPPENGGRPGGGPFRSPGPLLVWGAIGVLYVGEGLVPSLALKG